MGWVEDKGWGWDLEVRRLKTAGHLSPCWDHVLSGHGPEGPGLALTTTPPPPPPPHEAAPGSVLASWSRASARKGLRQASHWLLLSTLKRKCQLLRKDWKIQVSQEWTRHPSHILGKWWNNLLSSESLRKSCQESAGQREVGDGEVVALRLGGAVAGPALSAFTSSWPPTAGCTPKKTGRWDSPKDPYYEGYPVCTKREGQEGKEGDRLHFEAITSQEHVRTYAQLV